MEGAAVAVWLLAPRTRDERIRRRLVLATQNARDAEGVMTTMGKVSLLPKRLDAIRNVASRRAGLDPNGVVGSPPGMERIIAEAGASFAMGSEVAVTCWKACSGVTHSRQWASISLLDHEELSRVGNVLNLQLTASFRNVLTVTFMSVAFSTEARRLFAKRAMTNL
jgi:hypothetical protein